MGVRSTPGTFEQPDFGRYFGSAVSRNERCTPSRRILAGRAVRRQRRRISRRSVQADRRSLNIEKVGVHGSACWNEVHTGHYLDPVSKRAACTAEYRPSDVPVANFRLQGRDVLGKLGRVADRPWWTRWTCGTSRSYVALDRVVEDKYGGGRTGEPEHSCRGASHGDRLQSTVHGLGR